MAPHVGIDGRDVVSKHTRVGRRRNAQDRSGRAYGGGRVAAKRIASFFKAPAPMSAPCPILGFTIQIELHDFIDDSRGEALRTALEELLESNGLTMAGGGRRRSRFVVRREGSQATEADRRLVLAWAAERGEVADVSVSDLIDLNPAS